MFQVHDREFLLKTLQLARDARKPPEALGLKLEPTWAALLASSERVLVSEVFRAGDTTDAVDKIFQKFQSLSYNQGLVSLYLNIEPRARFERLAPVTESIRKLGVKRVVFGALDPAPRRAGEGVRALRELGVETVEADGEEARFCQLFLEDYAKATQRGLPWVFAVGDFVDKKFQLGGKSPRIADAALGDGGDSSTWKVLLNDRARGERTIVYRKGKSEGLKERELAWIGGEIDLVTLFRDLSNLGLMKVEIRDAALLEKALNVGLVDCIYLPEPRDIRAVREQKLSFASGASYSLDRLVHDEETHMLEASIGALDS